MADIEEIKDQSGELRRLGSLVLPMGFVSALPPFEGSPETPPLWTDAEILRALKDPNRPRKRDLFPAEKFITNQRSHGSCNGFAAAGAYTRARYMMGYKSSWRASGAWIYSLINGGRDQGSMLDDGMRVGRDVGFCSDSIVSWDQIYPNQQDVAAAKLDAAKHKSLKAYRATTLQGWRTGLATGLYLGVAAVMAGNNYMRFRNGIAGVDHGPGNHAVCVTDLTLRNGTELFDQDGSWGVGGWGDNGRGYLVADHFRETFKNHAFYLIPAVQEKV